MQQEAPLPLEAVVSEIRRKFRAKMCLHPRASNENCSKVIAAHTIQRAGALKEIADSTNHVCTFYPVEFDRFHYPKLHRRGLREASTFYGFCERHDGITFRALEQAAFTRTVEQCFLLAYRAHSHELYQKLASQSANPRLTELASRGKSSSAKARLHEIMALVAAGVDRAIYYLQQRKEILDVHL